MDFIFENDHLKVRISSVNGSLLECIDKKTGWRIQNRKELAQSFRLLVPQPERRLCYVHGHQQQSCSVKCSADSIFVTWEKLVDDTGVQLAITFTVEIILDNDGLSLRGHFYNGSDRIIEVAAFPVLGDIGSTPLGSSLSSFSDSIYSGASQKGLRPQFIGTQQYFSLEYPYQAVKTPHTAYVLLNNDQQGVYVGCHGHDLNRQNEFVSEMHPGLIDSAILKGFDHDCEERDGQSVYLEHYVNHYVFTAPHAADKLTDVFIKPYVGDWTHGIDIYKKWRSQWYRPPATPAWAKEVHAWYQVQLNCSEDALRYSYTDIIERGKECVKNNIQVLHLVGWTEGGQDRHNPSHNTDDRLGTQDEFKAAIAAVQGMGVKVVLFNKYTWADRTHPDFESRYKKHVMCDFYGDDYIFPGHPYHTPTQLDRINTRRMGPLCPLSKEWREMAHDEFRKNIALGADGILYDECQHHDPGALCFSTEHGHRPGVAVYDGDHQLAQEFRAIMEEESDKALLYCGESLYDRLWQDYSFSYFRTARGLPLERYIDSDAGILITVNGYNDRGKINVCLMHKYIMMYEPRNFKGHLAETQQTVNYGTQVDALRRRYSDWLWTADYRYHDDVYLAVNGEPYEFYSVMRRQDNGRRAITIVNFDHDTDMIVTVSFNGINRLSCIRPEQPEQEVCLSEVNIPPASVIIVLEG